MSLDIKTQSHNNVAVVGTLLSMEVIEGNGAKCGPFKRGNAVVRVGQNYGGRDEVNEITLPFFAAKLTSTGKPNPMYATVEQLEKMRSAQNYGLADADRVKINLASLEENAYYNRHTGGLSTGWRIRSSFANRATTADADIATFNSDIFVIDIRKEMNREGDETGRLQVVGVIITYGGKANVITFVVENEDLINFIQSNWEINTTWNIRGRVRHTTVVENRTADSGIGETIPESFTRSVRELVITFCDVEPVTEENCHTMDDIKIAMAQRKATNEQIVADGKSRTETTAATRTAKKPVATSDYDWDN